MTCSSLTVTRSFPSTLASGLVLLLTLVLGILEPHRRPIYECHALGDPHSHHNGLRYPVGDTPGELVDLDSACKQKCSSDA